MLFQKKQLFKELLFLSAISTFAPHWQEAVRVKGH